MDFFPTWTSDRRVLGELRFSKCKEKEDHMSHGEKSRHILRTMNRRLAKIKDQCTIIKEKRGQKKRDSSDRQTNGAGQCSQGKGESPEVSEIINVPYQLKGRG